MQAKDDVEQELVTPYNPSFDTAEIQLFAEIISEARLGVSLIDNKASIEHIHDLIKEGNNRIQAETDKGILLLGNTGSGKTTFAHALCGISLKAMINEDTADLFFAATEPLEGFIIGNRMASETKIPNKCKIADITIWDCPGFEDTDVQQAIANSFYIQKIIATSKELKFILLVPESYINEDDGKDFIASVNNFMQSLPRIKNLAEHTYLVVTHVDPETKAHALTDLILGILKNNQNLIPEEQAVFIKSLVAKNNLHIFYQPKEVGEIVEFDCFKKINAGIKFMPRPVNLPAINLSGEALEYCKQLLANSANNFDKFLQFIIQAIAQPENCLNKTNNFLLDRYREHEIDKLLPKAVVYPPLLNNKDLAFTNLSLLNTLESLFQTKMQNMQALLTTIQQAVRILASYAETECTDKIQAYAYVLSQQYEYINFFSNIGKISLPDEAKIAAIAQLCKNKVALNLAYQTNNLQLEEDKCAEYYTTAIGYLDKYNSKSCRLIQAKAYIKLAELPESKASGKAENYCIKAIHCDEKCVAAYEKLGDLYHEIKDYAKAIECYQVTKNEFKIKLAFKKWLKQEPNDSPLILLRQAKHLETIGLNDKARLRYLYASGFNNHGNDIKTYCLNKFTSLANPQAVANSFINEYKIDYPNCSTAKFIKKLSNANNFKEEKLLIIPKEQVIQFLRLVAEGEQEQAETMLEQNPKLALYPGNVTDLSGRAFNNITGFQYAVWALDSHMWEMIRKHLPKKAAREQVKGLKTGSWVAQYGESASWQNLIDALDEVIKLCRKSKWDAVDEKWKRDVGNAQLLLPVHVVNQYCHPTRSFNPCPDFNDQPPLPRSRQTDKGDWFTCTYNGGRLGETCFAFSRGGALRPRVGWAWGVGSLGDVVSRLVVTAAVRVEQTALVRYMIFQTQLSNQLLDDINKQDQRPSM